MKSVKQVVLGAFLMGAVGFANAQAEASTVQTSQTETQAAQQTNSQQDNEALVKEAVAFQDKQDWPNALAAWKKVSASLPDWAPGYYGQGYVYQSMKDKENAQKSYEKYIAAVKPAELEASKKDLAYAHMYVAYALAETNKDEAKKNIAKSLEYDPGNADALKLKEALGK